MKTTALSFARLRSPFTPLALAATLIAGAASAEPGAGAPSPAPLPQAAPATQIAPVPPAPPTPEALAAVARVQAFYDRTSSFRSDFQQEFLVKVHNVKKTSRGHVTFSKPGKMDWVYDEPAGNRVVSDGALLRVYEANNRQMYEQTVDKSQYPAALSFLTGQGRLEDAFNFELVDGKAMNFTGGSVLIGAPKTPNPAYQKVLFYVDGPTSQVRRVLIIDGQGNHNRFDFVNPRVNEPVNTQQFTFSPPPGTAVIHP